MIQIKIKIKQFNRVIKTINCLQAQFNSLQLKQIAIEYINTLENKENTKYYFVA